MIRRLSFAPTRALAASLAFGLALTGCTHFGTNVAGDFSCRDGKTGCQPLSEVDGAATRELLKSEAVNLGEARQRLSVASGDTARTDERTLRVVFPAHVDSAGTLHDEATAWAVVEAPRWAGELRRADNPRSGAIEAVKRALLQAAKRAAEAAKQDPDTQVNAEAKANADANAEAKRRSQTIDSAKAQQPAPITGSSPFALPSPGGEVRAGPFAPPSGAPAAEGSDMSLTPHVRTPRPLQEAQAETLDSGTGEAAKAQHQDHQVPGAAPKAEPN